MNKNLTNLCKHLKTVSKHRKYVKQACFKMHIGQLGLIHDLSKYSPQELSIAKYYTGTNSPHENCRRQTGYSPSWLHHKYHNKHHWQYWCDDNELGEFVPIKMPYKYVIEMFCDFIGAGKAYNTQAWTQNSPWDYWINKCKGKRLMHQDSEYLVEKLLWNMKELGEEEFYKWYNSCRGYLKQMYIDGKITEV